MKDTNEIFEGGKKLPLMDDFYTIQGEGYQTGKPAYFIRLGGCDIGCSWCDSKMTWNPDFHKLMTIDSIVEKTISYAAKAVVVTGGEPTLYNLKPLCDSLKTKGVETYIETSGAYKLTGEWDWICVSPKRQSPPLAENLRIADELKVIIYNKEDIDWAIECANSVSEKCKLYLQPEWSRKESTLPYIIDFIKNNPNWNISLQIHKYIGIP